MKKHKRSHIRMCIWLANIKLLSMIKSFRKKLHKFEREFLLLIDTVCIHLAFKIIRFNILQPKNEKLKAY